MSATSSKENWDARHEAIVYRWPDTKSVVLGLGGKNFRNERHVVGNSNASLDDLNIDSLYVPGSGDTLIIALHGALVRNDVELPRFEWLGALSVRPEHQLYLADTVLNHSEKLTLGWFIGSESDDLTLKIANYINHIRSQLGIKKIVFVGSSGGGYASLAISTYVRNSTVVCFTPQTNVWKFTDLHAEYLNTEAFPSYESIASIHETGPTRFSLIERYKTLPRKNKFIYINNTGDIDHTAKHFKTFAQSMGVRLPNGRTFDQSGRFISFHYGDGHVPPPKHRLSEFIDLALEDLDASKKDQVVTAGFGGELSGIRFNEGSNTLLRVPPEQNSYYLVKNPEFQPATQNVKYTNDGVPLRTIGAEDYDHPVLQAQYLLKQLNTLRREGSQDVEAMAKATLRRWQEVGVESRGGLYLPYGFEWHGGDLQPPWYSAMAQGQALSAASRLYEVLEEDWIKEIAERLMRSFELLPNRCDDSVPWVVDVDSKGYLWLEEYPYPGQGQCVMNGHLFAAWGIYDYWRVFDDSRAKVIANAAIETSKNYFWQARNPGWSSHYDLNKQLLIRNYHQTHISQLEMTYNITGNPFFLEMSDIYESDFPSYQRSGQLVIKRGEHVLHKMDNTHVPTKSIDIRKITLETDAAFDFEVRTKVEDLDGVWLRIVGGEYDGWWAQEEPDTVFPKGCFDRHYYQRRRQILLGSGAYIFRHLDESGQSTREYELRVSGATEIFVKCKALWNGVPHFQVDGSSTASPVQDGYWLPVHDCQ